MVMLVEPGTTPEVRRLILRMEQEYQPLVPVNPIGIPAFATADLPPASMYPKSIAYDTTAGAIVYSDGFSWA